MLDGELAALEENVVLEEIQSAVVDGHPAFLVAFAHHLQHLLLGIDVGELEVNKLGHPKSAPIQYFDNDIVARRARSAAVEGGLHGGDVGIGKHVGKVLGACGHLDMFGGIVEDDILDDKHAEKGAPPRENAALGGGRDTDVVQLGDETAQSLDSDLVGEHPFAFGPTSQQCNIVEVGLDGVGRQVTLQTEVNLEMLDA